LLATRLAARLVGADWRRLSLAFVPLAGIGLFLGLSMMTATHLRAEGVTLAWLPGLRATLLAVAVAWSGWLGWQILKVSRTPCGALHGGTPGRLAAFAVWLVPLTMIAASWWLVFFVW
jgi:hypothetical protein